MLHSQNSGKYLSAEWARDRRDAVEDKTKFTAAEQTYLDISGDEGTVGHQDSSYKIDTTPIDPNTSEKHEKIDIRLLPQMGGNI